MQSYRYLSVLLLFSSAFAYSDTEGQATQRPARKNVPRAVPVEQKAEPQALNVQPVLVEEKKEEVTELKKETPEAPAPQVMSTVETSSPVVVVAATADVQETPSKENAHEQEPSQAADDESLQESEESSVEEPDEDTDSVEAVESPKPLGVEVTSESDNTAFNAVDNTDVQRAAVDGSSSTDGAIEVNVADIQKDAFALENKETAAPLQKEDVVGQTPEAVAGNDEASKDVDDQDEASEAEEDDSDDVEAEDDDASEESTTDDEEEADEANNGLDASDDDSVEPETGKSELAGLETEFKAELSKVLDQTVKDLLEKYPKIAELLNEGTYSIEYTYTQDKNDDQLNEHEGSPFFTSDQKKAEFMSNLEQE